MTRTQRVLAVVAALVVGAIGINFLIPAVEAGKNLNFSGLWLKYASLRWTILDKVLRLMRACLQHLTKHDRTRRKICYMNRARYCRCMSIRTLFAIVGALISGGAMLAIPHISQVAEARLALN